MQIYKGIQAFYMVASWNSKDAKLNACAFVYLYYTHAQPYIYKSRICNAGWDFMVRCLELNQPHVVQLHIMIFPTSVYVYI